MKGEAIVRNLIAIGVMACALCGCTDAPIQNNGAKAEDFPRATVFHKTIEHEGHKFIVWQGHHSIAVIRHPDDCKSARGVTAEEPE